MHSRTYTDTFLYQLHEIAMKVAIEIGFYLSSNSLGTKYNPFPTVQKLIEMLESDKAKSQQRELDFYKILVLEEERGSSYYEEKQKMEDKRNSLIFKLKGINFRNDEELESLRKLLTNTSESARKLSIIGI